MASAATKTHSVPGLDRGLTLLELLAQSRSGLNLPEMVERSGFPKSSVHCLILTLRRRGYLYRNERTGRYLLGHKIFGLLNYTLTGLEVRERAAPYLRALAQNIGRTVHLGILEQNDPVIIAKFEPPSAIRQPTWVGQRLGVHCTSIGKALAAYIPEERLNLIVREHGLPQHNENTIVSARRLKEDLERVRQRGYAIDDEEAEIGQRCIGGAVFDREGQVAAAISIAGTTAEMNGELLPRFCKLLIRAAADVSRELGFAGLPEPGI